MIKKTPVSYGFLLLCLLVSLPSAFSPVIFNIFSGELPHQYWWQNFSMAFQHGAAEMPMSVFIHLGLNAFLILSCGTQTERLIGSSRFLVLSLAAWAGFILTQNISGIWINGASGIIWAYSPFLLIPILKAKKDGSYREIAEKSRILLIIMWGLVSLFMGFVPLIFNPEHSLLHTFFYGNLFHAAGTLIGFIFFFAWKGKISFKIQEFYT